MKKLIFIFLICAGINNIVGAQKLNDSLTSVIKKEQTRFASASKCPECPADVVVKYLGLIKSGNFAGANALVSYETCKKNCDMPFLKKSSEEIKANAKEAGEITTSFSNYSFSKTPFVVYADKNTAFVYDFIVTSASYPPILAIKVNGKWKLLPNNKEITNELFGKLNTTLYNQTSEYILKEKKIIKKPQ